jgi:hypothetical protein
MVSILHFDDIIGVVLSFLDMKTLKSIHKTLSEQSGHSSSPKLHFHKVLQQSHLGNRNELLQASDFNFILKLKLKPFYFNFDPDCLNNCNCLYNQFEVWERVGYLNLKSSFIDNMVFDFILKHSSKLLYLKLSKSYYMMRNISNSIVKYCKCLLSLDISGGYIFENELNSICSSCIHLQVFKVDLYQYSNASLQFLLTSMKNISLLKIYNRFGYENFTSTTENSTIIFKNPLRYLDLSSLNVFNELQGIVCHHIFMMVNYSSMIYLNLRGRKDIPAHDIYSIVNQLQCIKVLNLSHCNVMKDTMECLITCRQLNYLALVECNSFSLDLLNQLVDRHESLKKLWISFHYRQVQLVSSKIIMCFLYPPGIGWTTKHMEQIETASLTLNVSITLTNSWFDFHVN